MVFLLGKDLKLDNNEVYWSGMRLEYQPTLLKLDPSVKVK
jgi:hypothetical protein